MKFTQAKIKSCQGVSKKYRKEILKAYQLPKKYLKLPDKCTSILAVLEEKGK